VRHTAGVVLFFALTSLFCLMTKLYLSLSNFFSADLFTTKQERTNVRHHFRIKRKAKKVPSFEGTFVGKVSMSAGDRNCAGGGTAGADEIVFHPKTHLQALLDVILWSLLRHLHSSQ
jgi:hypothetical protein